MRLSLDSHPEKYEFFAPVGTKGFQAIRKFPSTLDSRIFNVAYYNPVYVILFGGFEFARRHLYVADLSHSNSEKAWHWCAAAAEAIPVLGTLIALVESTIYGFSRPLGEHSQSLPHSGYRPLWSTGTQLFSIGISPNWSVPHWLLITSIKKDTKLDDLKGCDFDKTEGGDMAILCAAAYVGNIDLIRALIPTMSEFTSTAYHSPLIYAIEGRQPEALKALLEELPDAQEHLIRPTLAVGAQDGRFYPTVTPLWLAAQKLQDVSLVKPLLQARVPTDDDTLAAQGIDAQGIAVIQRAANELAEESQLLQECIPVKNVIDSIIAGY